MKSEKNKEIEAVLLSERARVLKILEGVSKETDSGFEASRPDYGTKEDENAAEIGEYSTNITVEANLEQLLEKIDTALKKLKENTYGLCDKCKNEIPEKRLKANPSAIFCVACQEGEEKK